MTLEKFIKIMVEMIIYCVNNVFLPIFFGILLGNPLSQLILLTFLHSR